MTVDIGVFPFSFLEPIQFGLGFLSFPEDVYLFEVYSFKYLFVSYLIALGFRTDKTFLGSDS